MLHSAFDIIDGFAPHRRYTGKPSSKVKEAVLMREVLFTLWMWPSMPAGIFLITIETENLCWAEGSSSKSNSKTILSCRHHRRTRGDESVDV
jgi:hypothetical protein